MELPEGAQYCGACGAPSVDAALERLIPAQPTDSSTVTRSERITVLPSVSAAPAKQSVAGWRRILVTVGAVLAVGSIGGLVLNDLGTHHRLGHTRATLATTSRHLNSAQAELTSTKANLATTQTTLASTKSSLDETRASLAADQQQLQGVRNTLSDAKNRITVQSGQIETLKSCLTGVSTALSDAAYGDYTSAVSALQAVQVSCQDAANIVG